MLTIYPTDSPVLWTSSFLALPLLFDDVNDDSVVVGGSGGVG